MSESLDEQRALAAAAAEVAVMAKNEAEKVCEHAVSGEATGAVDKARAVADSAREVSSAARGCADAVRGVVGDSHEMAGRADGYADSAAICSDRASSGVDTVQSLLKGEQTPIWMAVEEVVAHAREAMGACFLAGEVAREASKYEPSA